MVEQLGAHLVRKGLLSQAQLDEALKSRLIYGGSLGSNLVELGMLDLASLGQALSDTYHFPLVSDAELAAVSAETVALLKPELARTHLAFPLALEGRRLRMALAEPQDPRHVDSLAFATGMRIVPSICPEPRLLQVLELRYGLQRPARPVRPGQARVRPTPGPAGGPPPGAPGATDAAARTVRPQVGMAPAAKAPPPAPTGTGAVALAAPVPRPAVTLAPPPAPRNVAAPPPANAVPGAEPSAPRAVTAPAAPPGAPAAPRPVAAPPLANSVMAATPRPVGPPAAMPTHAAAVAAPSAPRGLAPAAPGNGVSPAFAFGAASTPGRPPGLVPKASAARAASAPRGLAPQVGPRPAPNLAVARPVPVPVAPPPPSPPPPPAPPAPQPEEAKVVRLPVAAPRPEPLEERAPVAEPSSALVKVVSAEPPRTAQSPASPVSEIMPDDAPVKRLTETSERDIPFESALADILRTAEPSIEPMEPIVTGELLSEAEPETKAPSLVSKVAAAWRRRAVLELPANCDSDTSGEMKMSSDIDYIASDSGSASWTDRGIDVDLSSQEEQPLAPAMDFVPDWDPATEFATESASGVQWVQLPEALEAVGRARTHSELGRALLAYAEGRFPRGFLLGETFGSVRVGQGFGPGSDRTEVAALQVSLGVPSMLARAVSEGGPVFSNKPASATDEQLFEALGELYSHLLVAPIRVKQRTVGFLVIDGGPAPFGAEELDELERLLLAASEAYGQL